MQLVHSHKTSTYTFILSEDEWYSGTEQQREAWVNQITRDGKERKCRNLNILVKPDPLMSVSPVSHVHSVWTYIVPAQGRLKEAMRDALMRVREQHVGNADGRVSPAEARELATEIFG